MLGKQSGKRTKGGASKASGGHVPFRNSKLTFLLQVRSSSVVRPSVPPLRAARMRRLRLRPHPSMACSPSPPLPFSTVLFRLNI